LISNELDGISNYGVPLLRKISTITEHQLEQNIHIERGIRYGLSLSDPETQKNLDVEIATFSRLSHEIDSELEDAQKLLTSSVTSSGTEDNSKMLIQFANTIALIGTAHRDYEHLVLETFSLFSTDQVYLVTENVRTIELKGAKLNEQLISLVFKLGKFIQRASSRALEHEQRAMTLLAFMTAATIFIGVPTSLAVSKNIIQRIQTASVNLEIISSGDLTRSIYIDGNDEIGKLLQSIETMQCNLSDILEEVNSTSQELASASEEIATTMEQTAANTQEQQVATAEASVSVKVMTRTMEGVSMKIAETSSATAIANTEATKGQQIVTETISEIQKLALQIDTTANVIYQVEQSSEDISAVLEVIRSIAEQTNLLALNAAIEAARAGEQGRGFAVVADEVRTLAGRTQVSTIEINSIIEKLQSGAKTATKSMTNSRDQSRAVIDKATTAGSTLESISTGVKEIDVMSTQIASSAEEQSVVANKIVSSISFINDMSQQNAASVEEVTVAGQELARLASKLQGLVDQFHLAR